MSQRILREIKDIKQDKATDADCVPFGEDCRKFLRKKTPQFIELMTLISVRTPYL
jgi:hypothetical protein